ncbi:H(+)-transporting V1 sector ATPase subunit H [Rhizophlyctis rosea]|uniref:V-type proton ATPase subunit H n=1 Tax=Rhizophlyctis rosea TaxID=64517 RepID=A0AAD5SJD2_9FUNG|nr:H(+)-transporting V1 sector ATPase subunit H [Rhizophlyctis rosea]
MSHTPTKPAAPAGAPAGAAPTADTADVSIDAPIVASHNKYLEDQSNTIRARTIPWEGYQRATLITEEELAQIRQFEKSPAAALSEAGDKYILMFLTLLQKLVRTDTIQNILVLIDDVLQADDNTPSIFFKLAEQNEDPNLPYAPFTKLLKKDDEYIQLKSAKILIFLLLQSDSPTTYDPTDLFAWLASQMQSTNASVVDIAVQLLQSLLSITQYRLPFYQSGTGMVTLVDILKKNMTNPQMQYQTIYILWLLTYIRDIAADLQRKFDVVPLFLDIAKAAIKEKVVRVIVATFRNILEKAPQENMSAFIGNKVLNVAETLSGRKWSDTEIGEDLEFIKEELSKSVANLSTFDEYASEVRSGKLEWSPAHLSEQFWKQNAGRLNEKDYELLRLLSRTIATSRTSVVLAVAAHDVGQYAKHCSNGKKAIQDIGIKTQVMQLMTHEDPDVRYQALVAVQYVFLDSRLFQLSRSLTKNL